MCVLFSLASDFLSAILISGRTVCHCVGQVVENLDPEIIRVDTGIMFVSRQVPKLEGPCKKKLRSAVDKIM